MIRSKLPPHEKYMNGLNQCRVSHPRGPPPVVQAYEISNLAKDFKISREISRDFQISKEISRFPERFLGFRRDFLISGKISRFPEGFPDFRRDFRISGEFPVLRRDIGSSKEISGILLRFQHHCRDFSHFRLGLISTFREV